MKRKLSLALIFIVAVSCYCCHNRAIQISSYIEKNCSFEFVDTCYIDMQRVLGKEYDALYLFSGITPPEMMAELMQIPYNKSWLGDDQYRLILVDDDEVVLDVDMWRRDCNWHLPECELIRQHIFSVVKNDYTGRYELTPRK